MIQSGPHGPLFTTKEWVAVQKSLEQCVKAGYLTQAQLNVLIADYNAYVQNHGKGPAPGKP
jgi:hypothetical protein